jgi:hypothetical protein
LALAGAGRGATVRGVRPNYKKKDVLNPKKISWGLAVVAALAAAPALSIPLVFDLAGSVQSRQTYASGSWTADDSAVGQAFTAQVIIETDLFTQRTASNNPTWRDLFISTGIPAVSPWDASLTVNGTGIPLATGDLNYAYVDLNDSGGPFACGPGCAGGVNDSLSLVTRSDQSGPLGVTASSLLQLLAYEPLDLTGTTPSTYIDLDQPFDVASLVTIPLPNLSLAYGTSVFDCQALNLCFFSSGETTRFNVTSVTRSSATSVPEPGPLGLMGAVVLAMTLARRRRRA